MMNHLMNYFNALEWLVRTLIGILSLYQYPYSHFVLNYSFIAYFLTVLSQISSFFQKVRPLQPFVYMGLRNTHYKIEIPKLFISNIL